MDKKNKIKESLSKIIGKYIYIIIIILSIPAVRYLFVKGFFGVSDDLHIAWIYEMDRVVKMFQFPPRYVPDLSYGFGYPLFNFVYPLPFYVAEVFHLIGFSLVNSIKIVFGLSIPLSMYFMYKLLRVYVRESLSLAGSVLYVYSPYRALEIFVRGTIGEIVAFVLFPLVILSFIKITSNQRSLRWVGIGGLGVAALILSHNIMAYMFMPFLIILILARVFWFAENKGGVIKYALLSLFLGLLSSIYFWFPAIYESRLMHYDTVFNFYDHFPTIKQFITPYWGYGASVPGPYDTMSFYMGLVGLLVIVAGSIFFMLHINKFKINEKIIILWSLGVFTVSVFMMNHRSAFLWYNLPLLPYFQFPWRFLAMTTLVIPLLIIAFSKLRNINIINVVSSAIILLAIVLNFNYFKTSEYLGRLDDYYINRYIPIPSASEEYKKTSEEYLRLPRETQKRPDEVKPRAYSNLPLAITEINEINSLDSLIKTDSDFDFEVNYSKYNYPGWVVTIDGKRAGVFSGKPYGQISFKVPSGKHEIKVEYRESSVRLFFDAVSILTFGYLIYLVMRKK